MFHWKSTRWFLYNVYVLVNILIKFQSISARKLSPWWLSKLIL